MLFRSDFAMSVLIMVMPFLDTKTGEVFNYIGLAAFALSAVLTVWSGINYIVKNREVLKD